MFKSLETEIICYFDNVWKQEDMYNLNDWNQDNWDKYYHYIGQVTGENDCCESVRNKELRNIIEKQAVVHSERQHNINEE